jgi:hypothetical protein
LGNDSSVSATFTNRYDNATWNTLFSGNNKDGYTGDHQIINSSSCALGVYCNSGAAGCSGMFNGSGYNINVLDDGQAHTIAAVGAGSYTTFYVVGTSVGTVAKNPSSNIYAIGNYNTEGQVFTQRLDNVQIHSRALTVGEVMQVANGQKVSDGLEACYDFEGANHTERLSGKSSQGRHLTNVDVTFDDDPEESTGAVSWSAGVKTSFSYDGSTLTKTTASNGWGTGTFSNKSFVNDGGVSFEVTETDTHRMIGLSGTDPDQHYNTINYAIFLPANNTVRVYENGALMENCCTYATGDVFSIQREGEQIRYYENNVVFHISSLSRQPSVTAASPLHVDTAFYDSGSSITNVELKCCGGSLTIYKQRLSFALVLIRKGINVIQGCMTIYKERLL